MNPNPTTPKTIRECIDMVIIATTNKFEEFRQFDDTDYANIKDALADITQIEEEMKREAYNQGVADFAKAHKETLENMVIEDKRNLEARRG